MQVNLTSTVDLSMSNWDSVYTGIQDSLHYKKTDEEILDDIPIQTIQKYLRAKKLQNLKDDGTEKNNI